MGNPGSANLITVTDVTDPRLRDFAQLTDTALRRTLDVERGLYLAESPRVIARALDAGHVPRAALLLEKWLADLSPMLERFDLPVFVAQEDVLERITGFHLHRGAIVAMQRPELPDPIALLSSATRVVVLEDIVDHTNVGAIFRAVAGLGADAVLVTPRCADPFYRRSVRVSMGAVLQIPWTRIPWWPDAAHLLHGAGFHIAALALSDDAVDLADFAADAPERVALVLGTEGEGLTDRAIAHADSIVTIPMERGVDSLNVAAASAIALWALRAR